MFERIGVGVGHCHFCTKWGPVAVLQVNDREPAADVEACEACIRAAYRAAELLALLRKAKAKGAKKPRTRAQSSGTALPRPLKAAAVSSLVPAGDGGA